MSNGTSFANVTDGCEKYFHQSFTFSFIKLYYRDGGIWLLIKKWFYVYSNFLTYINNFF